MMKNMQEIIHPVSLRVMQKLFTVLPNSIDVMSTLFNMQIALSKMFVITFLR